MKRVVLVAFLLAIWVVFPFNSKAYAAEGKPVVFGVPQALGTIEGRDAWRAVQLAVKEINAKGGIYFGGKWHKIKAYVIDTREAEPGVPVQEALTAYEKLILEKKPDAIVGASFRSEVLLAAMDLIARYKIPFIDVIAMTPLFQKKIRENYDRYKYCFRCCLNAQYLVMYLDELLSFLNRKYGFNKVHFVIQDTLWAKATGKGVMKWCKAHGWKVTGFDVYPLGARDFSSSLMKIRIKGSQVAVPIFDMPESAILIKQAKAMKIPVLFCGFISPAAPENAWQVFKGGIDGFVNLMFEIGPIPVEAVPKSVHFHKAFCKMWGKDGCVKLSGHGPAPAYDSVYIMAKAIEKAGGLDPDAIVSAIEKTDMMGAVGRIRFTKDHQVIYGLDPKKTAIGCAFQWRKPGKRIVVFPEVVAEGKIELPSY